MSNDIFRKYRARIVREGILRAVFWGLILGCAALLLTALVTWLVGFKEGLFLGLALFVAVAAASASLLYFKKFRPTAHEIAKRVDALGLEDRIITMTELEGETSYMAQRQREDALTALRSYDALMLRIAVSVSLIVMLVCACVLGLGGTTVSALYYAGTIPSGVELFTEEEGTKLYTFSYLVGSGEGKILYWSENGEGEEVLDAIELEEGAVAPAVIAVPAANYAFAGWSDGSKDPYRQDSTIGNLEVRAVFRPVSGEPELSDDVFGDLTDPNAPPSGNSEPEPGQPGDEPNPDPSTGDMNGRGNSSQQIIDGNTYYGDEYNDAYNDAMDRLGSDEGIPDDMKDGVSDYLDSIRKGGK